MNTSLGGFGGDEVHLLAVSIRYILSQ